MVQGEVLYFDAERGIGFANGDDGNRYHFDRSDLPDSYVPHKGARIGFSPAGNRAASIQPEGGFTAPPAAERGEARATRPSGAVPPLRAGDPVASAPGSSALLSPEATSLWGYFLACVTRRYGRFSGRARRKEYWAFLLFFVVVTVLLTIAGAMVDAFLGNLQREEPIVLTIAPALFVLAMVVPSVAVTVRRIHDIGLSGWFVLLGLIPTIGNLIIVVFALIPSQKQPNRWGEVPAGAL
jgi:uncharacterized membrane protein YhaH (DUF805 family)